MTRPYRRRRILIDRLQYRLLAVNVLYFGVVAVVFAVLLFGPLIQQLLVQNLDPAERDNASVAFLALHQRIWPPLIIAFLCLTAHSIFVSHRIAGPLYQFRKLFARMKEGDLTVRARLRRGDYLTSEADIINEMGASLERRLLETQKNGLDLCAGLESLKRELANLRPTAEVLQLMEILDSRADRFRESIVGFKTASNEPLGEDEEVATLGAAPQTPRTTRPTLGDATVTREA